MADWTKDAVDALERAVGFVRDKTVLPAQKVSRAVVFGTLVSFFGLVAAVLLLIGVFRALVVLVDDVWLAYLILGGIFVVAGAFCWRLRTRAAGEPHA